MHSEVFAKESCMTETEIFDKIVEIVDPLDPITLETVVRECADIDSLALFNIVFFYKQEKGLALTLNDLISCNTVGDIVKLIASK